MADAFDARLGEALRRRRQALGLTLKAVAARSGLSHPFISQVERGVARPSMDSLQRLADALETTPFLLLGDDHGPDDVVVVRADERPVMHPSASAPVGELRAMPFGPGRLHAFEVVDPSTTWGEWYQHDGDELVHVVAGSVELEVDGRVERLGPGDSVCYPGKLRHRARAVTPTGVRLLYVAT